MDIFIISHNRPTTISTPNFFDKKKHTIHIILSDEEQLANYKRNLNLEGCIFHVSNTKGHMATHDWKYRNLLKEGEWSICADDNLLGFEKAKDEFYYDKNSVPFKDQHYETIPGEKFLDLVQEDLKYADSIGAKMYGTAILDNPGFRKVKYRNYSLIQHKFYAVKKDKDLNYDLNVVVREEYDVTAAHILKYGKVLRNEWLFCKRKHFMEGGIGSYEQRAPGYAKDAIYLSKKYPGLIAVNNAKKHYAKNTEIAFRITNSASIRVWRLYMQNKLNNI